MNTFSCSVNIYFLPRIFPATNISFAYFAANDMVTFLLNWYKKFPEFKTRDLFLTGESYAGLRMSTL